MFILEGGLLSKIATPGTMTTVLYLVFAFVVIVSAYLLGSINSAIIFSRLVYGGDIRKHGSGNPGLTNMLRTYGKRAAGLTLLGDIMKNALAIFIAAIFFGFNYAGGVSVSDGLCYVAGLFAVIGHIAPVYYKFKGGKGVLSTAVMALILSPIPFLILFVLFVVIVAISKYVSLGSVISAILYPIILNGYFVVVFNGLTPHGLISLSTIIIAVLIVWRHKENLKRIGDRTERKISFKKTEEPLADDGDYDESEE